MKFYTDKAAKAEIATLTERVESLEADNESAAKQIETLTEQNKSLTEQVTTATAAKDTAEEKLTELTGELETAKADATAAKDELEQAKSDHTEALSDFEGKVEAAALAKFESLGGQPLKSSKHDNDDQNVQKVSREKFNSMTPAERTEFSKSGGQLK